MCQAISGIAVKTGETVKIYTLRHEDSHEKIRDKYKIKDNNSPASFYQTPVELIPVTSLFEVAGMKFKFDDERPNWWTDEMTGEAIKQLYQAWRDRWDGKILIFKGSLNLGSLTSIPEGVTLSAGGGLYLSSLTSIPEGVNLSAGGGLYLGSLTAIPEGVNVKAKYINLKEN